MWDRLLDDDVWYAGLGMTTIERQEKYRQWIESQIEEREWEEIRQATQRGRLIGRETFQKQVEAMTGRRLAQWHGVRLQGWLVVKILVPSIEQ